MPPRPADFGTQVLPVTDAPWGDDYDDRGSRSGYYQDRRRRRLLLGGLLAGGTALAIALIALVVSNLGSTPPAEPTAAQSPSPPAATAPATTPAAPSPTASPTPAAPTASAAGTINDSVSGLSFTMLSPPWNNGCPASLSNQQTLTWTAGEQATAGQYTSNGQPATWVGEACSGPLPQQYGYNGVAQLQPMAMNLVNQFDGPYYGSLNHQRTQLASTPVSVSGHPGWEIKYLETYPDAATMGLPFNSEEAAVVVIDQGTGLPPGVFFASVPSNLGVSWVDSLVGSLQMTVTQASTTPPPTAPAPPADTTTPAAPPAGGANP